LLTPFFLLHSFPAWGSVLNMLRLLLVHGNTFYAVTDKRFMLRSGFLGTDFKTIEFDQVNQIEVNVGPVENLINCGTLRIDSGRTGRRGATVFDNFVGIDDPYTVFKLAKKAMMDVKADINYPNALRPAENPGYKSTYTP